MRWLVLLALSVGCAHTERLPPAGQFFLSGFIEPDMAEYVDEWLTAAAPNPVMVINSPGGYVHSATAIMAAVSARGDVTCVVSGRAASGAFGVMQACKTRMMTWDSRLITHEPRRAFVEPITRHDLLEALAPMNAIAVAWNTVCRSRLKISQSEYDEKVRDRDWIMFSDEALRVGAVDRVLQ